VVADLDEAGAQETAALVTAAGGQAAAVKADNANLDDTKAVFAICREAFGRPDILVANVGFSDHRKIPDITEESYYKVFDINVKGTLFYLKEAFTELNDNGRIVCTSSSTALFPQPAGLLYPASKAAVLTMAKTAAYEMAPRGICVNAVLPGVTDTPSMRKGMPPFVIEETINGYPFHRLGTPEDIADVVAFLCSENSRWVSGQAILVNGGAAF
jgi:3-oxoacyl-[acyl-carrier protein] reductase